MEKDQKVAVIAMIIALVVPVIIFIGAVAIAIGLWKLLM